MKPGTLYAEWHPPEDVPSEPAPQEFPPEYPEGLPPIPEETPSIPEEEPPAPEEPPIPPIPDELANLPATSFIQANLKFHTHIFS